METTNKLKDINEVLEFLYQEFPNCFKQKEGIKPLKVGIFKDIAERIEGSEKVSKTQVRQALRKYTSHWRYLEAVVNNEYRVDLDGNQAEKVEQEHVEHAKLRLSKAAQKWLNVKSLLVVLKTVIQRVTKNVQVDLVSLTLKALKSKRMQNLHRVVVTKLNLCQATRSRLIPKLKLN